MHAVGAVEGRAQRLDGVRGEEQRQPGADRQQVDARAAHDGLDLRGEARGDAAAAGSGTAARRPARRARGRRRCRRARRGRCRTGTARRRTRTPPRPPWRSRCARKAGRWPRARCGNASFHSPWSSVVRPEPIRALGCRSMPGLPRRPVMPAVHSASWHGRGRAFPKLAARFGSSGGSAWQTRRNSASDSSGCAGYEPTRPSRLRGGRASRRRCRRSPCRRRLTGSAAPTRTACACWPRSRR